MSEILTDLQRSLCLQRTLAFSNSGRFYALVSTKFTLLVLVVSICSLRTHVPQAQIQQLRSNQSDGHHSLRCSKWFRYDGSSKWMYSSILARITSAPSRALRAPATRVGGVRYQPGLVMGRIVQVTTCGCVQAFTPEVGPARLKTATLRAVMVEPPPLSAGLLCQRMHF